MEGQSLELYFLRHAIAQDKGEFKNDSERPLTPEGVQQMHRAILGMDSLELSFDRVFSSPYVRAKDTAQLVVEGLECSAKIEDSIHLTPAADAEAFLKIIQSLKPNGKYLFVGHMPSLSEFVSLLVAGRPDVEIDIKKGGLCRVDLPSPELVGRATLQWLLTSTQLQAIAEDRI